MRLLFLFLLGSSLLAAGRPGGFEVVGPGGGGAMFHPTISPRDPATMLVACDMTGGYITHDGGQSWRMFNLRGVIRSFAFDPLNAKTIYAITSGLWRSADAGLTWSLVWPAASEMTGIQMDSDHADETILSKSKLGRITAIAVDPRRSQTLVAGTSNGVYRSGDAGASWTKITTLTEPAMRVWVFDKRVYTATAHGIQVDGRTNPGPPSTTFTDWSAGDGAFYGASSTGAWVSRNAGQSWDQIVLPGTAAKVRAIATSSLHPESAYVS